MITIQRYKVKINFTCFSDFPGGPTAKNLRASAGDTGSNLGPGRSHKQLSPTATTAEACAL